MTDKKIPTKAQFAKMSKEEQQMWLKWDENCHKNIPIVDPIPEKKTATKKKPAPKKK